MVVAQAISLYWDTYARAMEELLTLYPNLVAELPPFMTSPQDLRLDIAVDGVHILHTPSSNPEQPERVANVYTDSKLTLDEVLVRIDSTMQPPFPPGEQMAMLAPGLQAIEVGTGKIIARASGPSRLEVVGDLEPSRWDLRWAATAASADYHRVVTGLVMGSVLPFASAAERALHASADALEALLDEDPTEERLHQFLVQSPQLLSPTNVRLMTKPPFGRDFVADFAIEDPVAFWTLVEIERSTHKLFTKAGDPTSALTHATRQVRDWREWVRENRAYARKTFPGIAEVECLVVIGRSTDEEAAERLRQYNDSLHRIGAVTWDELVWSARRQANNLHGALSEASTEMDS